MDYLKVKGIITASIYDEFDNLINESVTENLVTNNGVSMIIKCIVGEANILANRIVIGKDNTEEQKTDSSLFNKLVGGDAIYEKTSDGIIYSVRFEKNTVTTNHWIKEVGLAYYDEVGDSETLITRATFDSEKEVFITTKNSLSLKYQLFISV